MASFSFVIDARFEGKVSDTAPMWRNGRCNALEIYCVLIERRAFVHVRIITNMCKRFGR